MGTSTTEYSQFKESACRWLFRRLEVVLEQAGCDGTHRHTRAWARAAGYNPEEVVALVRQHGGCCCDCEVLWNVPESLFGEDFSSATYELFLKTMGEGRGEQLPLALGDEDGAK